MVVSHHVPTVGPNQCFAIWHMENGVINNDSSETLASASAKVFRGPKSRFTGKFAAGPSEHHEDEKEERQSLKLVVS